MATRRGFLAGLAAVTFPARSWADAGSPAFLAAGKDGSAHMLHGLSASGDSIFAMPLPPTPSAPWPWPSPAGRAALPWFWTA